VWRQNGALVKHLAVPPGTADLSEKAYPNILTWCVVQQRCWNLGRIPRLQICWYIFTCLRQTVLGRSWSLHFGFKCILSYSDLHPYRSRGVECRVNLSSGLTAIPIGNFILCLLFETREIGMDLFASPQCPHSLKFTHMSHSSCQQSIVY
jgi:hypothetical protein